MCLDVFWEQLGKHPHKQVRNIPFIVVYSLELLHPKQEMVSFSLVVNIYKIIDLNFHVLHAVIQCWCLYVESSLTELN